MDDPIFEPWSVDDETSLPALPQGARWRSPAPTSRPTVPLPPEPERARKSERLPRQRLAATPGFLRTMVAPRLSEVARRLRTAGHDAAVQDLLDGPSPKVRLTMQPWSGPVSDGREPARGVFEVALDEGPEQFVTARFWLLRGEVAPVTPDQQDRVSATRLGAQWLEARVLAFVGRVLAEA